MIGFLKALFGSGVVGAVEKVALESIETNKEEAEAKALWVKTLDPNGIMRRELSNFACKAYGFYLIAMVSLIVAHFFGWGEAVAQSKEAMEAIKELFLPITTAWGGIVGASFGVNTMNSWKGH